MDEWELEEWRRARWRAADVPPVDPELLEWPSRTGDDTSLCFGRLRSGPYRGELCGRPAGAGTDHVGVGYCRQHGGNEVEGRREAAMAVGHRFGQALDMTPWDALLWAVRIAAGKVAYIEHKLAQAREDSQFKPPAPAGAPGPNTVERSFLSPDAATWVADDAEPLENLNWWVKQGELWHDKLVRVSKLAIDAGVAERMVQSVELEAQLMLRATNRLLDDLALEGEARDQALTRMAGHILAIEAEGRSNDAAAYLT